MSGLLFWEQFGQDQIEQIIVDLNIDVTGSNSETLYVYCPYHYNRHSRAAQINAETGWLYCHSCGKSVPLIQLVMDINQFTKFEALRWLHPFKRNDDMDIERRLRKRDELELYDQQQLERLHLQLLSNERPQQYLTGRGITEQSFTNYMLGYSSKRDMLTIPVPHPHKPGYVGFVGRSLEGKRFKNSTNLPRRHTLFGIDRTSNSRHVWLTESSLDAVLIAQHGEPAVASLGSTITDEQLLLLSRWRDILVVQDNDTAGTAMWQRVVAKLPKHTVRHVIWPDETYKDVGESGFEYVKENLGG